jgi:hypothetical protein
MCTYKGNNILDTQDGAVVFLPHDTEPLCTFYSVLGCGVGSCSHFSYGMYRNLDYRNNRKATSEARYPMAIGDGGSLGIRVLCVFSGVARSIPPISVPPAQVIVEPPQSPSQPTRAVLTEFERMSADELSTQALAFDAKLRKFLNDAADQQNNLTQNGPRITKPFGSMSDADKQAFQEAWNSWSKQATKLYQDEIQDFDSQYQVDAMRLRDAMLERLPFGSRGPYYGSYEIGHHVTTFDLAYIAADLQRLASEVKSVPKANK